MIYVFQWYIKTNAFYYLLRRKYVPELKTNWDPDLSKPNHIIWTQSINKKWWDLNKKSKNMKDAGYDGHDRSKFYSVNKRMRVYLVWFVSDLVLSRLNRISFHVVCIAFTIYFFSGFDSLHPCALVTLLLFLLLGCSTCMCDLIYMFGVPV